tara:strand:+ start:431 stop:688 length:258 start_codon:yes stop_codon:yes gene_type:complete
MSFIQEQDSVNSQIDTILKNRYRRFRYLQRHNRMEDAIAVADEFLEWLDPEYFDKVEEEAVTYYCQDELEEEYHEKLLLEDGNDC